MCVTNHLQHFHQTVEWIQRAGHDNKPVTHSEYFKGASSIHCYYKKLFVNLLICNVLIFLCGFFFSTYKLFSPQVNIFIHYPDAAISLTPYTKLTRKVEKYWLLPWLAPAKTNSLTSEHGVLLDWICLPARLCQSQGKKKNKRGKGRGKLRSARCSLATEKRQKKEPEGSGQKNQPSFVFTSSSFTILFTCMADIYRQELQSWGKAKLLWLPDPQAPWRTAKLTKS